MTPVSEGSKNALQTVQLNNHAIGMQKMSPTAVKTFAIAVGFFGLVSTLSAATPIAAVVCMTTTLLLLTVTSLMARTSNNHQFRRPNFRWNTRPYHPNYPDSPPLLRNYRRPTPQHVQVGSGHTYPPVYPSMINRSSSFGGSHPSAPARPPSVPSHVQVGSGHSLPSTPSIRNTSNVHVGMDNRPVLPPASSAPAHVGVGQGHTAPNRSAMAPPPRNPASTSNPSNTTHVEVGSGHTTAPRINLPPPNAPGGNVGVGSGRRR